MLIDTHCHLDAAEFDVDRAQVAQSALEHQVDMIVVPAIHRHNFQTVTALSKQFPYCAYALGIHPLYVESSQPEDLHLLRQCLEERQAVAVGEIGLDFYIGNYDRERQEYFFVEQLKLAKTFDLPVILHVRGAIDTILKHLRTFKLSGGIAHAFNGSEQQAHEFIKLGFKLGFGGAMSYSRALKLRHLAAHLPMEAIVLETDAPDIPPEWIGSSCRNSPDQLYKIAQVLAELRNMEVAKIVEFTGKNAVEVLPKLTYLYTSSQVSH
jgi:TatD DNase family protein